MPRRSPRYRDEGRKSGAGPLHRGVVRFPLCGRISSLGMDVNDGLMTRPAVKLYRSTLWAAGGLIIPEDDEGKSDVSFSLGGPPCISCGPDGKLELVATMRLGNGLLEFYPCFSSPLRVWIATGRTWNTALFCPPTDPEIRPPNLPSYPAFYLPASNSRKKKSPGSGK